MSETPPLVEPSTAPSQQLYEEIRDITASTPLPPVPENIPSTAKSLPESGGMQHPYEDVKPVDLHETSRSATESYQLTVCSAYGV